MSPGRAITCKHLQDLLDDYRRGKLLPGQRQLIADHLKECDDCTTELRQREDLAAQMLAALPKGKAPETLPPAVVSAIAVAARADSVSRHHRKHSSLLPVMLTAAAAIIAAVALYQAGAPNTSQDAVIAAKAPAPTDADAVMGELAGRGEPESAVLAETMSLPATKAADDAQMPARELGATARLDIEEKAFSREGLAEVPASAGQAQAQAAAPLPPAAPARAAVQSRTSSAVLAKDESRELGSIAYEPAARSAKFEDLQQLPAEQADRAVATVYSSEDKSPAAPAPAQSTMRFYNEAPPASHAQKGLATTSLTLMTTATAGLTTATATETTGTTSTVQGGPR